MVGSLIVRELLTKFGFQVDKKQWDNINAGLGKTKGLSEEAATSFVDLGKKIAQMSQAAATDIRHIDEQTKIFGGEMEANRAKADRLKQAIVALTEQGVKANDHRLRDLIADYRKYNTIAGEAEKKTDSMAVAFSGVKGKLLAIGGSLLGGAALKKGFDIFSDFDAKLREVSALTQETAPNLAKLREAALSQGADSGMGARQAADGLIELSSAGFTANEQLQTLATTMKLARAGNVEVGAAAELLGGTLRQFNLPATQAGVVGNVLAQAAADSAVSMKDLAYTMKMGATTASATGQSLQEVATFAAVMGNRLIRGEQGGTILRGALTELLKPTKEQASLLENLGVKLVDVRTKAMLPLSKILDQLRTKLGKYGAAQRVAMLTTIFGKEPLAGISAALNISSEAYEKQRKSIMNASGALDDMTGRMDAGPKAALGRLAATIEDLATRVLDKYEVEITGAIKGTDDFFRSLNGDGKKPDGPFLAIGEGIQTVTPLIINMGKSLWAAFTSQPVQDFLTATIRIFGAVLTFVGQTLGNILGLIANSVINWNHPIENFKIFFSDQFQSIYDFVVKIIDQITGYVERSFQGGWLGKLAGLVRDAAGLDHAGNAAESSFGSKPGPGNGRTQHNTINQYLTDPKQAKPATHAATSGAKSGFDAAQVKRLAGPGGH
jgi:TP901 family phage tail tape measure protein